MNAPGLKCIKAFLIGSGVNICPKKSETAWVEGEVVEKKISEPKRKSALSQTATKFFFIENFLLAQWTIIISILNMVVEN